VTPDMGARKTRSRIMCGPTAKGDVKAAAALLERLVCIIHRQWVVCPYLSQKLPEGKPDRFAFLTSPWSQACDAVLERAGMRDSR